MKNTAEYKKIIQEELAKRCERNPRYSLRAFAKALSLEPGVLSLVLSGKSIPSYKTAQIILSNLDLMPEEVETFLSSLAKSHKTRGIKRLDPHFRKMPVKPDVPDLNVELFRIIGDWYHYAILMLTHTEGFRSDYSWIAKQLQISRVETKLAIDRLLNLELLRNENGNLVAQEGYSLSDKSVTTPALKRHQKQILEKAIHSLENDPIETRSMTSFTMAVDPEKIPEAKKLIEKFTQEMSELMESGRRLQVYELGISLYPLQSTQKEKKNEKDHK